MSDPMQIDDVTSEGPNIKHNQQRTTEFTIYSLLSLTLSFQLCSERDHRGYKITILKQGLQSSIHNIGNDGRTSDE